MSPLRARKALNLGKWLRVNFTLRSVLAWFRDWQDDGHVTPGRRPWSSISVGPRGLSWNSQRGTVRADLPGPFSAESDPFPHPQWGPTVQDVHDAHVPRGTVALPPTPVTDDEAETQQCPRCGAEPGYPCRTATTGDPTSPHAARRTRAREAH